MVHPSIESALKAMRLLFEEVTLPRENAVVPREALYVFLFNEPVRSDKLRQRAVITKELDSNTIDGQ